MTVGLAVGMGSNAMAVPAVPTIYDSVTGFTWGLPMTVSLASGTNWQSKKDEITSAGYTPASLDEVYDMYQDLYSSFPTFSTFLTAFGLSNAAAYTTSLQTENGDQVANVVGILDDNSCLGGVLDTVPCKAKVDNPTFFDVSTLGFMYYTTTTTTSTPEPSMIGLFGGMMLSMAWIAHRRLRRD